MKRKGKIHPSPPQPTASSLQHNAASHDSLSVLNLLPAAILSLAAVLSLEDREVLAYMITRSLKTPTNSSINAASSVEESKKFYHRNSNKHKPPVFDCECFECYISFWFRWDSSPNRELIHEAIEAFEEKLANGEVKVKGSSGNRRGRRKKVEKEIENPNNPILKFQVDETPAEEAEKVVVTPVAEEEEKAVVVTTGHKGYARKVVLGVLNSRLWNLWGPNC